jgi:photosystem II stability/assembly factor-like uncharacterized protein
MKKFKLFTAALVLMSLQSYAQGGWTICNIPSTINYRIDDLFMLDTQTGYAVSGGHILKTTDGGINWITRVLDNSVTCRSVEFINSQKGFVGALSNTPSTNILRRTVDGGSTWTDLTPLLDTVARRGICGLAIPDSNTIYGCGNWFRDSAYIIKSMDGGNTWSFIDMHTYATHLIDMYFLNKDTGFATGSGPLPLATAVILYTTDGGLTWTYKFQNTIASEYCWKIQHLTDQIYFASIQDMTSQGSRILKSTDGGMTWHVQMVDSFNNNIQGVGFIDSLKGWTGGGLAVSYETIDGGVTWDTSHICILMNRLFKVNDTLLFASGMEIWKYNSTTTGIASAVRENPHFALLDCYPNPANKNLTVDVTLEESTHALIIFLDNTGKRIKIIDSAQKPRGVYKYQLDTGSLEEGIYFVVLKTHEDQQAVKVIVSH